MLDRVTRRPIQVCDDGGTALIIVNAKQGVAIMDILQRAGIPHAERDEGDPSSSEEAFGVTVIVLGNPADANRVRALLDAAW